MPTIHEKLMSLPMFRGIAQDSLMSFIEKTNLQFDSYDAGEEIVRRGDKCEGLICLMSGEAQVEYILGDSESRFIAHYDTLKVFGMDHLYGMSHDFCYTVRASKPSGTLTLGKEDYMKMVRGNNICEVNLLNDLSYRSQKTGLALSGIASVSLIGRLGILVMLLTDRNCLGVEITGPHVRRMIYNAEASSQLKVLEEKGLVISRGDFELIIPDRNSLIEFAEVCNSGIND